MSSVPSMIYDTAYATAVNLGQQTGVLSLLVYNKLTGEIRNKIGSIPLVKELGDKHVEFYPNILMLKSYVHDYTHTHVYRPTMDNIAKEPAAIKWSNESLTKATLTKTKKLTYPKFVRELIGGETTIRDDALRDYGAKLRAAAKPYELKYAETVDDYIHMYNDRFSCAGIQTYTNAMNRDGTYWAWWDLVEQKTPPCSWIMYNPQTQGVYIEDGNGDVIARTVLCREAASGPFKGYSRIYGTDSGKVALQTMLANACIPQFIGVMKQRVTFRMPAAKSRNNRVICPSCALDTYSSYTCWAYAPAEPGDPEAPYGHFIFGPKSETLKNYCGSVYSSGHGYITPSTYGLHI